jgi:hypothetical protein
MFDVVQTSETIRATLVQIDNRPQARCGVPRRGEFRAFTDQMLEFIDRLRAAEETKRAAEMGSPEFVKAAKDAEELSRMAFRWAQMQVQMALEVQGQGETTSDVRLINVEPRPLDRVLAAWREAQMRLELASPGSPESEAAVRDIERLREEYQAGHRSRLEVDGGSQVRHGTVGLD